MNSRQILVSLWIIILLFSGCNRQRDRQAATDEEMMTARTLGLAYLEENKLEEAKAEFLKLVELDPKEVLGYANLGIVYLRLGEYDEAEDWLKKAIDLDPEDPDVRLILAKVYEMSDQRGKSIDELEKIIRLTPGHVKSLYQLTELYSSTTDPESMDLRRKYLNELVNSVP
ncbi:MAG: tetratricopeptide repeat protein, partial [Bacteroidales bacterium]